MKKEMRVNREQERVNRIRDLYRQILACGNGDKDYAGKILKQLLAFQKEDGSFCVAEEIPAERDSRIYYYYKPTYYGAAALMHLMLSDWFIEDETVKAALSKALRVAMQRKLAGHGYGAIRQQLGTLKIFKDAGLYEWMCRFDDSSDDVFHGFCEMVRDIIAGYRERILSGNTRSDWDVDFRKEFEEEVADFEEEMVPYVWYASYGSNISSSRFQRYLKNCGGDVAAIESRAYTAQGALYFAAESSTWGCGKGVAFFDETVPGIVMMRAYKITCSQFREVQRMEGPKYSRKLMLGTIDDIPVYTFTALVRREDIEATGVSEEDYWKAAEKNTASAAFICSMAEMLGLYADSDDMLYVATTHLPGGASVLYLPDLFRQYCEEHGEDMCYILPSSAEEVIVIAGSKLGDDMEVSDLA